MTLHSQLWHYRVNYDTAESIMRRQSIITLHSQLWHYRINYDTTESITTLQSQLRHYRVNYDTAESIMTLQSQLWHYRVKWAYCYDFHAFKGITGQKSVCMHISNRDLQFLCLKGCFCYLWLIVDSLNFQTFHTNISARLRTHSKIL